MKIKYLLLLAALLPAVVARAQNTYDEGTSFAARASAEADVKLARHFHLTVSEENRTYSDGQTRFYTGAGLEYKFSKRLKTGVDFILINRFKNSEWDTRHRFKYWITGDWKAGDWKFALKEQLQLTHRTDDLNTWQNPRNALALKSRMSVKYEGLGAWVPYASAELRTALNNAAYSATYNASATSSANRFTDETFLGYTDSRMDRLRLELGVTWKISKKHSLDLYLMGDRYNDKKVDTNRETSESWAENGLILKHIDYYKGNVLWGGVAYKISF